MDSGELVSDSIILNMMKARIQKNDCKNGFVLDGFPRTTIQANNLTKLLDDLDMEINYVLVLSVKDDIIVGRMGGRRIHPASGRIYHIKYNPPKNKDRDDITNEKLTIRKDDTKRTVKKRLKIYHKTTSVLINYYNDNLISTIDGSLSINKVYNTIIKKINND